MKNLLVYNRTHQSNTLTDLSSRDLEDKILPPKQSRHFGAHILNHQYVSFCPLMDMQPSGEKKRIYHPLPSLSNQFWRIPKAMSLAIQKILNFWKKYENLNLKITFILISLQVLHLYWLTADVVLQRIAGQS